MIHKKALALCDMYICIGGMPASILAYLNSEKDITKYDDSILNMIMMTYLADMSKYTENMESIRNNKIYNSMPVQLGRENRKFRYNLVEKSAKAREYDSVMEWLISSNMLLKCQGVSNSKSPLKAYEENNFKVYLSGKGILRVF